MSNSPDTATDESGAAAERQGNRSKALDRPIVVVLGMHRSGTSLLSNVLHFLGVDMADTTDNVSPKNPGGFWERPQLVAIHDEILGAIGRPIGSASHVLPFPAGWWRRKEVQALKPKLIAYLREELGKSTNLWGFKDPRTCRLLPLWFDIFRELRLRPIYVHALRSPGEAALSMSQQLVKKSQRKISVTDGELMWLSYNFDVARYVTAVQPVLIVDYDEWFGSGTEAAGRLARWVGLAESVTPNDIVERVSSIVHVDYRHHSQTDDASAAHPLSMPLYEVLKAAKASNGGAEQQLHTHLMTVEAMLSALKPLAAEIDAAASLLAEKDECIAKLQRDRDAAISNLKASQQSRDLTSEVADQLAREHDWLATRLTPIEKRVVKLSDHVDRARDLENALAEVELARSALQRSLHRQQVRTRLVLDAAKRWRIDARALQALRLEDGKARLAVAEEMADLRLALSKVEGRLTAAERRNRRFTTELEARESQIATMRSSVREEPFEGAPHFDWPGGTADAYGFEGAIEQVDEQGVAGSVRFTERPNLVPVIEVRVDGALVLVQSCSANEPAAEEQSWRFSVPWRRFSEELAGREAIISVVGLDCKLGRVRIPEDLRLHHLPPAALAAEIFGGTRADAEDYDRWITEHERPEELERARAWRDESQVEWPTVSVIIHGKRGSNFSATIQSLRDQIHGRWEAICLDAPKKLADADPRVRLASTLDFGEILDTYPADALFAFVEAGDTIAPTALLHLASAALGTPDFALIYSDEDLTEPRFAVRGRPYMKGAWSPDLALAQDYVTRIALVRRRSFAFAGRMDSAAVYKTCLHAALSAQGSVIHLPFVLYHRSIENELSAGSLADTVVDVLKDVPNGFADGAKLQLGDGGWRIDWPLPEPLPRISLIVPTRDRLELLRGCIDGFLYETCYDNLEILIADNDSAEEETKSYLAQVAADPRVQVIRRPGPFNYSAINNLAAKHATGTLIGLMNNDLKIFEPDWLRRMASNALRSDIGIVGAKLLYGDNTIQHAGVTLGIGIASHLYKSFPANAEGRHGRLVLPQDVSAVTAACLLMRREIWNSVGGLDEDFPVAYNDVDLCLKVSSAGYRILWIPDAVLYHLESQSRGKDADGEKRDRLERDKERLTKRWGERLAADPFHSPNLSNRHVDARLAFPSRAAPPWQSAIGTS